MADALTNHTETTNPLVTKIKSKNKASLYIRCQNGFVFFIHMEQAQIDSLNCRTLVYSNPNVWTLQYVPYHLPYCEFDTLPQRPHSALFIYSDVHILIT